MQVTIYGANGKVGTYATSLALEKGFSVVAFVHASNPFESHERLKVLKGDIYDPESTSEALEGSDVVISALGSWGTPKKDVLTTAMKYIIPAMKERNLKKIVTLTGSDAEALGDSKDIVHRLLRPFELLVVGKILRDGEEHIALLEQSGLDWTVVRSPAMNSIGDSVGYKLDKIRPMPWKTINRRSVARAMVDALESDSWSQKAPYISRA